MSRRLHDADLCERIRDLEEEVGRLRAQVQQHNNNNHCHHYYPYWVSNTWGTSTSPTVLGWYSNTLDTTGGTSTSSTNYSIT